MDAFSKSSKKKRSTIAAEVKKDGMHITAAVGKRIVLSFLRVSIDSHIAALKKEIEARKIDLSKPWESMKWAHKKDLLKKHELGILSGQPGGASIGGKPMKYTDVKEIVPLTAEMKALLPD